MTGPSPPLHLHLPCLLRRPHAPIAGFPNPCMQTGQVGIPRTFVPGAVPSRSHPSPVDPSSPQVSHCLFHLSTNPLAASGQIGIVTEFIGIIKRWENPSHNSSMSENIKQFAARRSPWAFGWFVAGTCLSSSDRRGKLMPPLLP